MLKAKTRQKKKRVLSNLQNMIQEFELAYNLSPELPQREKDILQNKAVQILSENGCEIFGEASVSGDQITKLPYEKKPLREIPEIVNFAYSVWPEKIDSQKKLLVLGLNKQKYVTGYFFLDLENQNYNSISPKVIFQFLLLTNSHYFNLINNKLEGVLEASSLTVSHTNTLSSLGKYLDLHLTEHIIISPEGDYNQVFKPIR